MSVHQQPICWRGFELLFKDEDSWSVLYESGYIGVSYDAESETAPDKAWSALIECGELSGDGAGPTAHEALYAARNDLIASAMDHQLIVKRHFEEGS